MRTLLLIMGCLAATCLLAQNDAYNLRVRSHWNNTNIQHVDGDQIWNDCIGWKDQIKGKEYFIAGSPDSLYVFDITDPDTMVLCAVKAGRARSAINRDYETYQHYLYTVSDRTSGIGGLQIFDLQFLPDSMPERFNSDTFGSSTHTILVDSQSMRLYMCMNTLKPAGISAMDVLSIADPVHPAFLGRLYPPGNQFRVVHEMFARHDTVFLSCESYGLFIMDMRDAANPVMLGAIKPPYVQNGYNHSSWTDSTGKYLMFTDETQGMGIKLYDISDIHNPTFKTVWNSHSGALPHNVFWKGGYAYSSCYEDGVYIYDLRNPASLEFPKTPPVVAYYDTYPLNKNGTYNGFHGCWGVWPFLPSGNLLASDISEGLFVLNTRYTLGTDEAKPAIEVSGIYPNPFSERIGLRIKAAQKATGTLRLFTVQGQLVAEKNIYLQAENNAIGWEGLDALSRGFYLLQVAAGDLVQTFRLIKN